MSKNIANIDGRQDVKTVLFEVTAANFVANGGNIDFEVEPGSIILAGRISSDKKSLATMAEGTAKSDEDPSTLRCFGLLWGRLAHPLNNSPIRRATDNHRYNRFYLH